MKPLYTEILEKFESTNKFIIIRESTINYPIGKSNIYCADNNFNVIWFAELPIKNDNYPNEIIWNTKINKDSETWNDFYIQAKNLITTSSKKGFTVTIDINNGEIIDSKFTK